MKMPLLTLALTLTVPAAAFESPAAFLRAARGTEVPRIALLAPTALPAVTGAPPDGYANFEDNLAGIWVFVRGLAGASPTLEPPRIHFAAFDPGKQDPEWSRWQADWTSKRDDIFGAWLCSGPGRKKYPEATPLCSKGEAALVAFVNAHPQVRSEFPFPPEFRAFHYDGTGVIQVNQESTYLPHLQTGPDGRRRDYVGYGYYVTGHEMMHYALESVGVPGPSHHCLFVTKRPETGTSYMEDLVTYLQDAGIAGFAVRRYGLQQEEMLDPCGAGKP